MSGYQQIEASRPSAFGTAGDDLLRLADQTGDTSDSFATAVKQVTSGGWEGDSRDAAAAADRLTQQLRELIGELRSASPPLSQLARTGEQGRAQLVQVSGEATAAGFEVVPTGMVVLGPAQVAAIGAAGPGAPAMAEELQLQAIMFTEDLWSIMVWVSEADIAAGEQLMALCMAHGGTGRLALSGHLEEHIFDGAWNNAGTRPVGYHHRPGGSDAGNPHGFNVVPGTVGPADVNSVYRADFSGTSAAGVTATKRSSYYADGWSEDDVRQTVAGAFYSRHPVYEWTPPTTANPGGRFVEVPGMWEGQYQGMTLRGYLLSPGQPGYRGRDVGNAELQDLATAFLVRVGDSPYGRRS
jgi:hypothetical protein